MKKCKMQLILLLGLFFVTACSNKGPEKISIDISLTHLPQKAEKAYLDIIKPAETITIDTISKTPNQTNFQFSLYTSKEDALYRIRIGNEYSLLFIGGKNNLQITDDYQHAGKTNIKGSSASEELHHFITQLNQKNKEIHQLAEHIYNPKHPLSDSLTQIKRQQLFEKKKDIRKSVLQKAQTTQSPNIALFALSILDNNSLQEEGKTIIKTLPQRFPGNFQIQDAVNHFVKKFNNTGNNLTTNIGDAAPALKYPNPQGKEIALSDFKGKYVLIDFWASWCAPCRKANPQFVKVYRQFKNKGFTILSVSLDTKKTPWVEAIKKDGLPWAQISDLHGWNSTPANIYNIKKIPANFLINPKGIIIAKDLSPEDLSQKLKDIFIHP